MHNKRILNSKAATLARQMELLATELEGLHTYREREETRDEAKLAMTEELGQFTHHPQKANEVRRQCNCNYSYSKGSK